MNIAISPKSSNRKVGPIPTTMTSAYSCPPTCPLNNKNNGGCYAEVGPTAIHWRRVTEGTKGVSYPEFISFIESLPQGQFYRHNVAGDLYGKGAEIDGPKLKELVKANKGKKGYTYTHKYTSKKNLDLIREANEGGFTINLSANNISEVDNLKKEGCPVVVILPSEYQRKSEKSSDGEWTESEAEYKNRIGMKDLKTPEGNRIVVCPATYRENTTCDTCRLCAKVDRSVVVAFPAHGIRKEKVNQISK